MSYGRKTVFLCSIVFAACFLFQFASVNSRMFLLILGLIGGQVALTSTPVEDCKKCIVLCEQSQHRIAIVDTESNRIIWEWKALESNIASDHVKWFDNPDEAKPVYDNKYILVTASGGGVALIRIADKKAVFYAYAGGNPHSAEVLPDGNIVSSSSTGNFLRLFKVDTLNSGDRVSFKSYPIIDGHNVVWDKKRQVLWAGSGKQLYSFEYNSDCNDPSLILSDSISLPANLHDMFPVYGKDELWLTADSAIYQFEASTKKFRKGKATHSDHIKSVSSGPGDFPSIIIHPKEKWWTDEVISFSGKSIFRESGLKIYKARWFLENHFSYPEGHQFTVCK